MKTPRDGFPTISNDAVRNATGRGWDDWFRLLDSAGAAGCTHREIVALVRGISGPGAWWEQMKLFWREALGRLKTMLERD